MAGPWKDARGIIVTTTPTIEGKPIQDYLGIVTGEVIVGANLFRDLFANIRDIVGGRSGSYERILRDAREQAIQELQAECGALGGNAVVGIDPLDTSLLHAVVGNFCLRYSVLIPITSVSTPNTA